jgi:hypothetical protein
MIVPIEGGNEWNVVMVVNVIAREKGRIARRGSAVKGVMGKFCDCNELGGKKGGGGISSACSDVCLRGWVV